MSLLRKLAVRLLNGVLRCSPEGTHEWANAMLRELDFIENDWAALFWALGSTRALVKHSGWRLRARFGKSGHQENHMNQIGKRAVGVFSGIVIAALLVLGALGLLWLGFYLFPGLGLEHLEWTHLLIVIVIPEAIFIVAIFRLWRRRASLAVGILLSAVVLAVHVAIHFATHWHN
ncbi:MAG: hypothetical protein ACRD2U_02060 [Terriglobales bacterium]